MKCLPCPDVDIPQYIAQLVLERQGGANAVYFTGIAVEWRQRCEGYVVARGDCVHIAKWQSALDHRVSFNNLYSHATEESVQEGYLTALRGRTLQFCPFCGEAGTPNTLDHYLPKEHFPQFAVLPQNLIPACDICQGQKKSFYESADGRIFVHPYYDQFLDGQVVRLVVEPPYDAPAHRLECHPDLTEEFRPLVRRHIEGIGLERRFHTSFRTEYGRLLRLAARCRAKGAGVAAQFEIMREHAEQRSLSSWEHILFEGVLSNADLIDYLQSGMLPALP